MNDYDAHMARALAEQNEVEALRREIARLRRERNRLWLACQKFLACNVYHHGCILKARDAAISAIHQIEDAQP